MRYTSAVNRDHLTKVRRSTSLAHRMGEGGRRPGEGRDRLSPERRSWNMSRIRGKDTTPERLVRFIAPKLTAQADASPGLPFPPRGPDANTPRTDWPQLPSRRSGAWARHEGGENPKTEKEFQPQLASGLEPINLRSCLN